MQEWTVNVFYPYRGTEKYMDRQRENYVEKSVPVITLKTKVYLIQSQTGDISFHYCK